MADDDDDDDVFSRWLGRTADPLKWQHWQLTTKIICDLLLVNKLMRYNIDTGTVAHAGKALQ